ncbi:helix-turn-helix domain-containing protein [Aquitalea denitrificans]|uniref:helix-turn-helix domain-containing protein n=1 Tax=Aquitalea denitrificans TaxID=519081 RepID=UPI00135AAC1B
MTQNDKRFSEPLPRDVRSLLVGLGQRVRTARVRRGFSTENFARECGIGRRSLYRIEMGDSGVALGTFLAVLWKLGLLDTVQGVANPDDDEHGKILEAARRPQRVRNLVAQDNDF